MLSRIAYFARGPISARDAAEQAVDTLRSTSDEGRYASALVELARTHSNLVMVSIVGERCDRVMAPALEAAEIGARLSRSDILAQALCYLGDARLSAGDFEGVKDLERSITLAGSDRRVETAQADLDLLGRVPGPDEGQLPVLVRVWCLVNAAGGAYRTGRFSDAQRYVDEGLRLAGDGEFFSGEYRLRLTRVAIHARTGAWDESMAELSSLLASAGEPGVMAPLACSILARLQARRGDPRATETLEVVAGKWTAYDDPFIAGPLAVATVELGWLDGSMGDLTGETRRVLSLVARVGPRSVHAELVAYLRRLGLEVPAPKEPPGPWKATLEGDWRAAAEGWERLGDRYEHALVLARADDAHARRLGTAELEELGALAVLPAL